MNNNKDIIIKFRVNKRGKCTHKKKFKMNKNSSKSTFIKRIILGEAVVYLEEKTY